MAIQTNTERYNWSNKQCCRLIVRDSQWIENIFHSHFNCFLAETVVDFSILCKSSALSISLLRENKKNSFVSLGLDEIHFLECWLTLFVKLSWIILQTFHCCINLICFNNYCYNYDIYLNFNYSIINWKKFKRLFF